MKKEVLIAIIIGFGLGLVITFGIWSANKALKQSTQQQSDQSSQIENQTTPTPTPTAEILSLNISSPQDNSIVDKDTLTIKGATLPRSVVVILFDKGEKILETDSDGQFSTDISLTGGENEITIKAYDKNGNDTEKKLTVVYSTAEI